MKYALAFAAALAVVAVICDSSIIKADTRSNLNVGCVAAGDRRLYSQFLNQNAGAANTIQSQNVIWSGNGSNKISAVRANEVGQSQNAIARIFSGGIGWNNVTVNFQSARGRGYHYYLEIFGR